MIYTDFFFFSVLNVRAVLPSTPDTRVNVRRGDRFCILFALCILGAVAAAGVCLSVSMLWAWTLCVGQRLALSIFFFRIIFWDRVSH